METIVDDINRNELFFKQLKKAQIDLTTEYLQGLLQIVLTEASMEGKLKELTFWKTAIHCDDGALYSLTLSHISGPKFQVPQKEGACGNTDSDLYSGC